MSAISVALREVVYVDARPCDRALVAVSVHPELAVGPDLVHGGVEDVPRYELVCGRVAEVD
jgi:hypothetical protein